MNAAPTITRDSLAPVISGIGRSAEVSRSSAWGSPGGSPGEGRSPALAVLVGAQALVHTLEQGVFAALTYELVGHRSLGIAGNGMLQALQALPLLLALPLGALADRRSRSMLVGVAELIRIAVYMGIALVGVTANGLPANACLALLVLALACGSAVHAVGLPAVVPSMIDSRSQLLRVNSGLEIAKTLGYMLGPLCFGWILASGGLAMVGEAASVLVLASACGFWNAIRPSVRPRGQLERTQLPSAEAPAPATSPAKRGGLARTRADVLEGLQFARRSPVLGTIFTAQTIFSLGFCCFCVAFAPHLIGTLGLSVKAAGAVTAFLGLGMFVGAVAAPGALQLLGSRTFMRLTTLSAFFGGLCVLSSSLSGSVAMSALGAALVGLGPMGWTVGATTLRQLATPADLQGRLSALNTATLGMRLVGALLGTVVGAAFGSLACFAVATVLLSCFVLVVWRSRAFDVEALPPL